MVSEENYGAELFQEEPGVAACLQEGQTEEIKAQNDSLYLLLKEKEQEIKELKKENEELRKESNKTEAKASGNQGEKGFRGAGILSNVLFYLILICAVLGVFLLTGEDGSPRNIFGYSYFTVLSTSMQREIPKGSLIITKSVEPEEIRLDDDITFFKDGTTTITHRVIEIYEDYQGTGQRGFRTKGIENPGPDPDIIDAQNVIGVVRVALPGFGAALAWVKSNFWLVGIMFALVILISFCIKVYIANGDKKTNNFGISINEKKPEK